MENNYINLKYMADREKDITVNDLKTAIRKYKREECKPFSKLNRAGLIEYVKQYEIPVKIAKKTKKTKKETKPKPKTILKVKPVKQDKPPGMDQPIEEVDVPKVNIPQISKPVRKRVPIKIKETGTAHLKKKSPKKTVERKKLTREEEAIIKEQERNRREEKEEKEREEKERNKQKKRNEKEEEERKAKAIKAFQEAEKLRESDRKKKRAMMTQQEKDADDYERKREKREEKSRAKYVSKADRDAEEKREKEKKEKESKQKREQAKKRMGIKTEQEKEDEEIEEMKKKLEEFRKKRAKQTEDGTYNREELIKWSKINKNIKIPPKVKDLKDVDEEIKFYADVMNNNVFGRSIFEGEYDIDPIKIQNSGYKYKNVKLKTNLLEFEEKQPTGGNNWFKQTKTIIGGRDFINNSKAKERVKLVELAKKEIKNMKQDEEDLEKYKDIVKNNEFYQKPSLRSWSKGNNKVYIKNVRIKDGALLFDRITDDDIGFEFVEKGGKWKWYKEKHIFKSGRDAKEKKQKPKKEEMKQDEKELEKFMEIVEKYELKEKISKTKMPSDKLFIKNVELKEGDMSITLTYEYITASQAKTNKPFKKETVIKSTAPVIKHSFRNK